MDRPNVILIVSDDHGYADRSALGIHPDVSTPALDRLAAEGVTCTDAYVTAPICSPSRAGVITGRYQQRWGNLWFDSASFPPPDVTVLPEKFAALGYRTGYLGKVHYGKEVVGDRACPPHHGFEETFYGLAGQSLGRLNYLRRSSAAVADYGPDAAHYMAVQPMLSGDEEVEQEGFLTAELGRRARAFVQSDDDRPYFLMIAFNAVHNFCWQLPAEELARRGLPAYHDWRPGQGTTYGEWYDDAIAPNLKHGRAYYLAQLELMDAEIGKLLEVLEWTGTAGNTFVAYTTDNGGSTCNFGDNTPLRGTKYTLWEGGIRVPMIFRWPSRLPAGSTRDALVSSLDLYPTLLSAAGAPAADSADCDGIDQLPVLCADGHGAGHEALHWDCGFQWAVREGNWKLSWVDPDSPVREALRQHEHAPVGEGWQLTDLAADPGERNNLCSAAPQVAQRLRARHTAWRAGVGLPAPAPARITSTGS